MNEPVNCHMKEFVQSEITKITAEHEKILSGWKNVDFTKENTKHLFNLFGRCNRNEIRIFEENNFLGEERKEVNDLLLKKLVVRVDETERKLAVENSDLEITSAKSSKKKKKKKAPLENVERPPEITAEKPILTETCASEHSKVIKTEETSQPNDEKEATDTKEAKPEESVEQNLEKCEKPEAKKNEKPSQTEEKRKNRNPFDNEDLFIEPLIDCIPNTKEEENSDETTIRIPTHYISAESNELKANLEKLATDISKEEKHIRAKVESGESATMDNEVLADFISRANTVLKETEAVTVRKIAEAETRKFLSSVNAPTENALETISNELMHDIWPKNNQWRRISRVEYQEEVDAKTRRKQDELVDRAVHHAIKSAGESLNKKQIGQIRKAAIVYRDFDSIEQQEMDFRTDHITKLVQLLSAYEATNKMDELVRMRLAIAFCTKRRDYFLKVRPRNFMQFSYMYIYLLEKINSRTASLCACLNYRSSVGSDFDELEELLLNLFHEDYFLDAEET